MAKVNLVWKYPEDRLSIALEMCVDNEPKAHMILDAGTFEKVIAELADARAQMAEPVIPDLEVGMRVATIPDPRWRTEPTHEYNGSLLALRHPGYGWLSFLLPVAEARSLGKLLLAQADELEAKDRQSPT